MNAVKYMTSLMYYNVLKDNKTKEFFECWMTKEIIAKLASKTKN